MTDPAPSHSTPSGVGAQRTLKADARKWLMVTAIGAGFVVIGIILLATKGDFLAWFVTAFFGLVAAVGIYQLMRPGTLELDADTFTVNNFGRLTTERWEETANFVVYRTGRNNLVAYDRTRDVGTHMAEMNRMLSGGSAGLPDTYGMNAQDLANLMIAYHAAALERAWQRHSETVAEFRDQIISDLNEVGTQADIIADLAAMQLPDDMDRWPSLLVVRREPRPDGSRHVLIAADMRSPIGRWHTDEQKQRDAFKVLGADELQIIDPATKEVRRIRRDETS